MIGVNNIILKAEKISAVAMQGDLGMMNVETGKYYYTNSIGRDIWELLDKPIMVQQIIEKLINIYEVDGAVCLSETLEFLELIHTNNLIVILE